MNTYLLDAGGAGLYYLFIGLFIIFMLSTILAEAGIMLLMKYHTSFKKAFLHSLVINIVSVAVGFILLQLFDDLGYYTIPTLAILYGVTVIVETICLQLLNKTQTLLKTIQVCIIMNIATYILLYFISRN